MRRTSLFVLLALALGGAPAAAQESLLDACGTATLRFTPGAPLVGAENAEEQFRYLCGAVVGALTAVQPTVGIAFTGGAHTLGTATTIGLRLGAVPRFSVTARANAALVELPALLEDYRAELDPEGDIPTVGSERVPVGSLQGDLVVGVFNGFSAGPAWSGLGAVDLLGSVSFVPAFDESGLEEDLVNWGVGARVGIVRQGLVMPGVSVSAMYRNMGEVSFGDIDDPDADGAASFATDLSTVSLRAAASKGILAFDLLAGVGYDLYASDVLMDWEVVCPAGAPPGGCGVRTTVRPEDPVAGRLETAAWNIFGNVGLNLAFLNVIAEAGYQKPTDVITLDELRDAGLADADRVAEDPAEGRFFGSVGVRLTF